MNQHTANIFATITNSPVGCAFWGFDKSVPSVPCLSFNFQSGFSLSKESTEYVGTLVLLPMTADLIFHHEHKAELSNFTI